MFCTNCGKQVPAGTTFCTACGARVTQTSAQSRIGVEPPVQNKADALLKFARGPLVTGAIICAIVGFVLTLFTWFMPTNLDYLLRDLSMNSSLPMEIRDILYDVSAFLHNAGGVIILFNIICNLPLILEIIGLAIWLASVRSEKKNGGLGLVKAGVIIQLVAFCVSVAIVIIALVLSMIGLSSFGTEAILPLFVALLVVVLVFLLEIFYFKGILSTIKATKNALIGKATKARPSMYVAVLNIIGGSITILSTLINLANPYVYMEPITLFSELLTSVALLLFGIAIAAGKRKVLAITQMPVNDAPTVYRAAPQPQSVSVTPPAAPVMKEPVTAEKEPTPAVEEPAPVTKASPKPSYTDPSFAPMTEDSPTQFCIHCGKGLQDGEICSCREK